MGFIAGIRGKRFHGGLLFGAAPGTWATPAREDVLNALMPTRFAVSRVPRPEG